MAFGTITVTESTFGSISGTVVGAIPGTLSGSVGVPGPAGPTGPQGPAGQGVPAGGTAGQFLTKIDGTNYNTDWTTINLSAYAVKANNLSDLTNAGAARNNLGLGATNTVAFTTVNLAGTSGSFSTTASMSGVGNAPVFSFNNPEVVDGDTITRQAFTVNKDGISHLNYTAYDFGVPDDGFRMSYDAATGKFLVDQIVDAGSGGGVVAAGYLKPDEMEVSAVVSGVSNYVNVSATNGINVYSGTTFADIESTLIAVNDGAGNQTTMTAGGITFPDASVQTTAFPGFNDAALTGNPTAPTAALGDNDTSIATTAFVQQELLSGTANARNLEVEVRNQSGSTMAAGTIVYVSGATGNKPLITKAQANNDANSAQTIGFVKTSIANNGTGYVIVRGELENIDTSALSEGVQLYLSPSTAGTWTTTKPSAPNHLVYVGIVIRSHPTLGTILVSVQNGFEVAELHDSAISSPANNDLFVYELSTDLWKNKSFSTLGLATLASPTFTGTPSLPTGTTAVTQSAGNNTTALATTAFVQQEVPAASTTAAGKVELATDAEVIAGTSTTVAMTPAANYWADKKSGHSFVQFNILSASTSGTGATAGNSAGGHQVAAPTSAVGYGCGFASFPAAQRGINRGNGSWNWAKAFTATFRYSRNSTASDSNSISRVTFGKNTFVGGDPTVCCVGIRMAGSNALQLIVHNGTTLTAVTTTSSIVPTVPNTLDIRITSDGAGNVSLFVNDVLEATTSAGPTGTSGTSASSYIVNEAQNAAIITGTAATSSIYNLHFEFAD